jgi:hypothetical protein
MTGSIVVSPLATGTIENLADNSGRIMLYPNPASQYIELKIPTNYSPLKTLKVYSLAGAVLDELAFQENSLSLRYDVSKYRSGIYFIEINSQTRKDVLKFIKQ